MEKYLARCAETLKKKFLIKLSRTSSSIEHVRIAKYEYVIAHQSSDKKLSICNYHASVLKFILIDYNNSIDIL
jgi:hypothetical protein